MIKELSGCILAGGLSTRMAGNDKGLISLNNKPLYQHIIRRLAPQVDEIIINANRHYSQYHESGLRVFQDTLPDFPGPLAGILTGLEKAYHDWVLFVPCDVPLFPHDLAQRLWAEKEKNPQTYCAYAADSNRAHPTFALCHKSLIPQLRQYLLAGDRKVMLFMQQVSAKFVIFDEDKNNFANLNTPQDCLNWEKTQRKNSLNIPILGVTAYSGTGKTTLLKKLIPLLRASNVRVALIKHTHHDMDVDKPGKDSYELRKAGAFQTLVASQQRWALMTETPEETELDLYYLASRFDNELIDIILVEGFKGEAITKIALYRDVIDRPLDSLIDSHVIALASDIEQKTVPDSIPQLDINQPQDICDFIINWLKNVLITNKTNN